MGIPPEVRALADLLRDAPPPEPLVALGGLRVSAQRCPIARLQYNQEQFELLRGCHDYSMTIGGKKVELSCQLYLNTREHYRLFAFSRCGQAVGMLFSLNLTTEKGADGIIALSQRLRFSEGRTREKDQARLIREAKTRTLTDILTRSGIRVTDNLEVEFGLFSSRSGTFIDTVPKRLLSQFVSVALLKGHIQGNKGYQFACLPRYDDSFSWKWDSSEKVRNLLRPNRRGLRGVRDISLAIRFQVLERDGGRCCLCGRSPVSGITLHVDHIKPYSLGGFTELKNLQTLCNECNLGKGNRSCVAFGAG